MSLADDWITVVNDSLLAVLKKLDWASETDPSCRRSFLVDLQGFVMTYDTDLQTSRHHRQPGFGASSSYTWVYCIWDTKQSTQ